MQDEADDLRIEGDSPLDWLRHVTGTVAVLLFPAWVMATALFAQADGLRFTVVMINGEPALVEVSSLWRFALAGVGAAISLGGLLAVALLVVWLFGALRRRIQGDPALQLVDVDLPAGTTWSVQVSHEGPPGASLGAYASEAVASRAPGEPGAPAPGAVAGSGEAVLGDAPATSEGGVVAPVPEAVQRTPLRPAERRPPEPVAAAHDAAPSRRVDADDEVDALFARGRAPAAAQEGASDPASAPEAIPDDPPRDRS